MTTERSPPQEKNLISEIISEICSSTAAEKGCFVVYTADKLRFAFPISYLSNSVFQGLLKIAEEEFGLPTEGPITLPFDSIFLEYLIGRKKNGWRYLKGPDNVNL
ncbi:hypothetical protein EUTSA_v10009169mg [Eutrema salsugineum]|uniref:Auxin-responsive protein n=1 Tax=Eutrema salsugineum TaxID=72664 RepID=V4K8E7_EUTSA|nr:hypothetical protein EUTSA_v10009169mg [Eutrema salsugineum]